MAIKTTLEQLEEVQTTISKVLAGQAVSIDGKSITRADLKVLYEREDILLKRYRAESNAGGPTVNYGVRKR